MICLGVLQILSGDMVAELFWELGGVYSRVGRTCSKLMIMIEIAAKELGVEKPITGHVLEISSGETQDEIEGC